MVYIATNPFTPQSGLEPKILGGRENLVEEFIQLLERKKEGGHFHSLMLGEWGMGKTSLLKYYKKLTQNKGFKAVYVPLPQTSPRESVKEILAALIEEISFGLGISMDSGIKKTSKNVNLGLTECLKTIFKNAGTDLLVICIDDIQNISTLPQVLDILRLALSSEDLLKNTNYLFLLASTPSGWKNFLQRYDPIGRFFRKKQILEKLDYGNFENTIKQTLSGSGVRFTEEIIANCWQYCEGHPYELQLLANHLYDNQSKGIVDMSCWEVSLSNTLKDLGIEYFSTLYNRASDREDTLLDVFAQEKSYISLSELKDSIIFEKKVKGYPVSNIKNFVYRLLDKGLLLRNEEKQYRILDNMFAEYILRFR